MTQPGIEPESATQEDAVPAFTRRGRKNALKYGTFERYLVAREVPGRLPDES